MATWVTPPTHATGDYLSITDWNDVCNDLTFLHQAPYGQYWNTSATSGATGTDTRVQLGGHRSNHGFVAPSTNQIEIPLAGVYTVSFSVSASTSGSGSGNDRFNAGLNQNGTQVIEGSPVPSYVGNDPVSNGSGILVCNAGDLITLIFTNNADATYSTNPSDQSTFVHLAFVGQA